MNRPYCLVGNLDSAKIYIQDCLSSDYESLILEDDISIEDLKQFKIFLEENSRKMKVGIIYNFGSLSITKQSVLLKIFESLLDHVKVFIHSFYHVNFTIHTRCNIIYLPKSNLTLDIEYINKFFLNAIKHHNLSQDMLNGIAVFFSTLNFYNLNLLTESEKNCIFEDLK